jgi:hypothetical protein
MFPHEMYGWFDMVMGLVLGVYVTLNARQRNGDCSSRLFALGVGVANYHKQYDRIWEHLPLRWILIVTKVGFDGYASFMMFKTCINQLAFSTTNKWLEAFKNKTAFTIAATDSFLATKALDKKRAKAEFVLDEFDMPEHLDFPTVGETLNPLKVIVWTLGIINDAVGIWINMGSNFYWYNFGANLTGLPTKIFILIDHVANTNIIVPTDI